MKYKCEFLHKREHLSFCNEPAEYFVLYNGYFEYKRTYAACKVCMEKALTCYDESMDISYDEITEHEYLRRAKIKVLL